MKNRRRKILTAFLAVLISAVLLAGAAQASSFINSGEPFTGIYSGGETVTGTFGGGGGNGGAITIIDGENTTWIGFIGNDETYTGGVNVGPGLYEITTAAPSADPSSSVPGALDSVNFPDAYFREFVAQFDLDGDGILSEAECLAVTSIKMYTNDMHCRPVTDLTGIGYFPNLRELSFKGNLINYATTIDLSGNRDLEYFFCYHGEFRKPLDLSGCSKLRSLSLINCSYDYLDISACPLIIDAYLNGETGYQPATGATSYCTDSASFTVSNDTVYTDSYIITFESGTDKNELRNALVRPGSDLTMPDCVFAVPEGRQFAGWSADGAVYEPGCVFAPQGNITFTAAWEDISVQPETAEEEATTGSQQPDTPAPASDGGCEWCGKTHTGFFGSVLGMIHRVFLFFAGLFGR